MNIDIIKFMNFNLKYNKSKNYLNFKYLVYKIIYIRTLFANNSITNK